MRTSILALAVVATLLASAAAHARIALFPIPKRVADSTLIVVGKVASATDGKDDANAVKKLEVTVTETLKGAEAKTVTFNILINRRNIIPQVGDSKIFYLKSTGPADSPTYELALGITPNSIDEVAQVDAVKQAVKNEKAQATQPM